MPVEKAKDCKVGGGTIEGTGSFEIELERLGADNGKTAAVARSGQTPADYPKRFRLKLGMNFSADMLPEKKADALRKLQEDGAIVTIARDGVNDAPTLAQAQVGIAMGTGTDVAIKTCGITLARGDFRGAVQARWLNRLTMRNIRQSLFFTFFYDMLGIPPAAGVVCPVFGILLSPMIAAAAMSLSSVSVIANSLRLRTVKL